MKYIALTPLRTRKGTVPAGGEIEISDKETAKKLLANKKIKEKK